MLKQMFENKMYNVFKNKKKNSRQKPDFKLKTNIKEGDKK